VPCSKVSRGPRSRCSTESWDSLTEIDPQFLKSR
jgi:hypothetical protein